MAMSQATFEPGIPTRLRMRLRWYTCAGAGCSAFAQKTRKMAMGAYCVILCAPFVCKNATASRQIRSIASL
eukprot:4681264-Pleurochrysis_carterae.AAC.1